MARRVPLHDLHASLGGSFVPFGAYEMPVRYASITEEHQAVRNAVGLFDVSHMGNLVLAGPDAAKLLAFATCADVTQLAPGRGVYTTILRTDGTIIDDTIVYREGAGYHTVPNSGMSGPTAEHLGGLAVKKGFDVSIQDVSEATCIFALQGPRFREVLGRVSSEEFALPPFSHARATVAGVPVRFSTTGYTGAKGVELFVGADGGRAVFEALLEAGRPQGIRPCGLGARDTLRLEMGYCLAGNEFAGGRTPLEAGLGWLVHWEHEFVGRKALAVQREKGPRERLVGLVMEDAGIPRHGQEIHAGGRRVGGVTSGTRSPSLGRGIARAYVETARAKSGTPVDVVIREAPHPARVARPPFWKPAP